MTDPKKIKNTLFISTLLLILFVHLILGYFYIHSFQHQRYTETERQLLSFVHLESQKVLQWKNERLLLADYIRHDARINSLLFGDEELLQNTARFHELEKVLDTLSRQWKASYLLFDKHNEFIAGSNKKQNTLKPEWMKDTKKYPFFMIEEAFEEENRQLFFTIVVPFRDQASSNIPQYFLLLRYKAFNVFLSDHKKFTNFDYKIRLWFKSISGKHVWTQESLNSSFKFAYSDSVPPLFQQSLNESGVVLKGTDLRGNKIFTATIRVPGSGFALGANIPYQAISKEVADRIIMLVLLFSFFLVIVLLLYYVMRRQQHLKDIKKTKKRDAFIEDIINAQPAGIYRIILKKNQRKIIDDKPNVHYEFLSQQHEQITGVRNQDLFKNINLIFETIHPEDKELFLKQNRNAIHKFEHFKWEGRILKNGVIRWLQIESTPRKLDNEDIVWTGIINDITQQKEMEMKLLERQAFEREINNLSSRFVNVSLQNFDSIIDNALGSIGRTCQVDRTYLFTWNKETNMLRNTHEWCAPGIDPQKDNLQSLHAGLIPKWMGLMKAFKPVVIENINQMPSDWQSEKEILQVYKVKSVLALPVISHKQLIGFVGLDAVHSVRKWEEFEVKMMKVFADLIYNAIEKRNSERDLIESKNMLRSVIDTIRVRVFWKDLNHTFLGCNQAFANDLNVDSVDEIIGKTDFDLVAPDKAQLFRDEDNLVMNSGVPKFGFEDKVTNPDGSVSWVRITRIPLRNAQGAIFGVLGSYEDITDQKRAELGLKFSERRYRKLSESAFDGIYLLKDDRFEYVNQRFCEITGYNSQQLLSNEFDLWCLFTDQGRKTIQERRILRKQQKEVTGVYEIQIVRQNGEIIDTEVSTTSIVEDTSDMVMGILRDITERKNNQKLRDQVNIAKQTVIFKQNFLANMSHEIRTPLTGVIGMIDILSRSSLSAGLYDYVNTLRISAENLKEIINQILDYSKIEAGQVVMKEKVIKTEVIFTNAKKFHSSVCRKNINLEFNIDANLPEYLKADEGRIAQIVNNLISNAVKFTEKGKIVMHAMVEKFENDGLIVKISVSDTGCGIKEELLPKLFTPFQQLDNKDTRNVDGTGLGLSISRQLAEIMGGTMGVSSKFGEGSTFWFTFRCAKANLPDTQKTALPETLKSDQFPKLKILLAEDKIVNQKVIKLLLSSQGHQVDIAANGREAVEKFQPDKHQLILMDIQMPEMDGITATHVLKEKYDRLPPVVGLSANAFEGDREKYMMQGLDEYITKPVKGEDFKNLLKKIF